MANMIDSLKILSVCSQHTKRDHPKEMDRLSKELTDLIIDWIARQDHGCVQVQLTVIGLVSTQVMQFLIDGISDACDSEIRNCKNN